MPVLAGVGAEPRDAPGDRLGAGALGRLGLRRPVLGVTLGGVGRRDREDDGDLLTVDRHLAAPARSTRRAAARRTRPRSPPRSCRSSSCNDDYSLTRVHQGSSRRTAEAAGARQRSRRGQRLRVGRRQVADEAAADERARRGPAGRAAGQQRDAGRVRRPDGDHRARCRRGQRGARAAPRAAGRRRGPATATSRGPSSSASATASAQPNARGARPRGRHRPRRAPARRPRGAATSRSARRTRAARRPRPTCPDGYGVVRRVLRPPHRAQRGVGAVRRRCRASRRSPSANSRRARCRAASPAAASQRASPVTACSASSPSATSP